MAADVTKGAFFHHFKTKEALGIAVAEDWKVCTSALFAAADYHSVVDPRDRVLATPASSKRESGASCGLFGNGGRAGSGTISMVVSMAGV